MSFQRFRPGVCKIIVYDALTKLYADRNSYKMLVAFQVFKITQDKIVNKEKVLYEMFKVSLQTGPIKVRTLGVCLF